MSRTPIPVHVSPEMKRELLRQADRIFDEQVLRLPAKSLAGKALARARWAADRKKKGRAA